MRYSQFVDTLWTELERCPTRREILVALAASGLEINPPDPRSDYIDFEVPLPHPGQPSEDARC